MDFDRTELLNPRELIISRVVLTDVAGDPYFDGDNDLLFSRNGCYIDFPKPLENFQWIEFEIQNVDTAQLVVIRCMRDNEGEFDTYAEYNGFLAKYQSFNFKLPNIGRVERIKLTGPAAAGKWIVIKSIKLINQSNFYTKDVSSSVGLNIAGWTFDATTNRYYKDFGPSEIQVVQVTTGIVDPTSYVNLKIYTNTDEAFSIVSIPIEGKQGFFIGRSIEADFHVADNVFPINVNVVGQIDNGGRIYAEVRLAHFPLPTNVFGATTQPIQTLPYSPGFAIPVPDGWLKGVAGILTGFVLIPYTEISGLGSMALQDSANVNITGGLISGVTFNNLHATGTTLLDRLAVGPIIGAINPASTIQIASSLGGTLNRHIYMSGMAPSNVTTAYYGTYSDLSTDNVAFTLGELTHYLAGSTTKGAASTINNIYGFNVGAGCAISGINSYGFYSGINKATNNWAFYGGGTGLSHFGGEVEIRLDSGLASASVQNSLVVGPPSGTGPAIIGVSSALLNPPTTATTSVDAFKADLALNQNVVYTVTTLRHFYAGSAVKAANPVITNLIGFDVADFSATITATNIYGYRSNLNVGTSVFAFYGNGTARSYFGGELGILKTAVGSATLTLGSPNNASNTVGIQVIDIDATTTGSVGVQNLTGVNTKLINIIVGGSNNLYHFKALTSINAGTNLTSVTGFYASNGIAVGSNNYGFYSDINSASNTYQIYLVGTALNYFNGELGIKTTPVTTATLTIGPPTSAGTILSGINVSATYPTTATSQIFNYNSTLASTASAYTVTTAAHYIANTTTKGAGSNITTAIGFYAANALAASATANYGFYSDIAANAAINWQLYLNGTGLSYFGGKVGINTSTLGTALLTVGGTHPDASASVNTNFISITAPATATTVFRGQLNSLTTVNSVFTVTTFTGYEASLAKGASAVVTNAYGFYVSALPTVGTRAAAFFTDLGAATSTWGFYTSGTVENHFTGPLCIRGNGNTATANSATLMVGTNGVSTLVTGTTAYTIATDVAIPSTCTAVYIGVRSLNRTLAVAFTLANYYGFKAEHCVISAGAAITNMTGYFVPSGFGTGVGGSAYGFYSDIASATNFYNFYANGTAENYFGGPVGILTNIPLSSGTLLRLGGGANHPSTTTSVVGVGTNYVAPATATALVAGDFSTLQTANSAFTVTELTHFKAATTTRGAASSITNAYGFYAANGMVPTVGTRCAGFYSDINAATNTYQLYLGGTAPSLVGGAFIEKEITETYSASITPDASLGNERIITVTNATAFTINAPTNPATGQYLEITIRNTSGGAMGVITWNAVFKMTAFTNPATANSRTIVFRYNGTNWVEKGRTAADIPN
jgi:hypothetical protein